MATTTTRPDHTEGMRTRELADGTIEVFETCGKCGGSGTYPSSLWEGACTMCMRYGKYSGGHWTSREDYNRRAHNRELAAARRTRKAQAEAAVKPARDAALHAELAATHPLLAELTYLGNVNFDPEVGPLNYAGILGDLRHKLETYGSLSQRQTELAEKIVREGMERQARADERAAARQVEAATRPNGFIAEVGERREFTGTVRLAKLIDGDYGCSTLLVLDTPEGTVKWFATGARDWEPGQTITIKATVKAHETYNGTCQTVVTRGKQN